MAEAKEQDLSIEEILESIRQIISDDPEAEKAAESGDADPQVAEMVERAAETEAKPEAEGKPADVEMPAEKEDEDKPLDLTEVVDEEKREPETVLKGEEEDFHKGEYDPVKEDDSFHKGEVTGSATQDKGMDGLLSDEATTEASAALAQLLAGNMSVEHDDPNRVMTPGRITLEDITRELLRPMLKTWLDQNLPRIVEKQVQREIERVSRKAMDR